MNGLHRWEYKIHNYFLWPCAGCKKLHLRIGSMLQILATRQAQRLLENSFSMHSARLHGGPGDWLLILRLFVELRKAELAGDEFPKALPLAVGDSAQAS